MSLLDQAAVSSAAISNEGTPQVEKDEDTHMLLLKFDSVVAKQALRAALLRNAAAREETDEGACPGKKNFPRTVTSTGQSVPLDEEQADDLLWDVANKKSQLEYEYVIPPEFLEIDRSFLPPKKSQYRDQAVRNLPGNAGETDIMNMQELMESLNTTLRASVDSTITVLIHAEAKKLKVLNLDGKEARNFKEICQVWEKDPSIELCQQLFYLLYSMWTSELESFVALKTQIKHQLWFSDGGKNRRTSFIRTIINDKIRDVWRTKINKTHNKRHGISLTITQSGEQKKRRDNKVFNFKHHVKGWGSDKHNEFLNKREGNNTEIESKKKPSKKPRQEKPLPLQATTHRAVGSNTLSAPSTSLATNNSKSNAPLPTYRRSGRSNSHLVDYSSCDDEEEDETLPPQDAHEKHMKDLIAEVQESGQQEPMLKAKVQRREALVALDDSECGQHSSSSTSDHSAFRSMEDRLAVAEEANKKLRQQMRQTMKYRESRDFELQQNVVDAKEKKATQLAAQLAKANKVTGNKRTAKQVLNTEKNEMQCSPSKKMRHTSAIVGGSQKTANKNYKKNANGKKKQKPHTQAPDDHEWEIVEIVGFEFRGTTADNPYLDVELKSGTGEYESYIKSGRLADWFIDDAPLVREYGSNLEPDEDVLQTDIWLLQEKIAQQVLFSDNPKAASSKLYPTPEFVKSVFPTYVPEDKRKAICKFNHAQYDLANYFDVGIASYFYVESGRLYGSKCAECKKIMIALEATSKVTLTKDHYRCGSKPTTCAYVCRGLYTNRVETCKNGGVLCAPCWNNKQSKSPRKTRHQRNKDKDGHGR